MSFVLVAILVSVLLLTLIPLVLWALWKVLYTFAVLTIPLWPRPWATVFHRKLAARHLLPESLFVVTVTEVGITCTPPKGEPRTIAWKDLASVHIRTNDSGPFDIDVIWGLHDDSGTLRVLVPGGATGENEMLEALQRLPNFDNGMVTAAMCSTQNVNFLCWQRQNREVGQSS